MPEADVEHKERTRPSIDPDRSFFPIRDDGLDRSALLPLNVLTNFLKRNQSGMVKLN